MHLLKFLYGFIILYNLQAVFALKRRFKETLMTDAVDYSITKCLTTIFKNYLTKSESILSSLDYLTDKCTDQVYLKGIYIQKNWTLYDLNSERSFSLFQAGLGTNMENYMIQIRGISEIKYDLKFYKRNKAWNARAKFIIFASVWFNADDYILNNIFEILWTQKVTNVIVLLPTLDESPAFNIFTYFPYRNGSCGVFNDIEILDICQDGIFRKNINLFPDKIPKKLNNCEIQVRTIPWPPYVIAPPIMDYRIIGLNFTQGLEIEMLNTISKYVNFKVIYTVSEKPEDWGYIYDNGEATGIFKTLLDDEAELGVASLASTTGRFIGLDATIAYTTESLTWCVPSAMQKPKWSNVFTIFDLFIWTSTYLTFLTICLFTWLLSIVIEESSIYKRTGNCLINMFAVLIGISINVRPVMWSTRTVFYLCAICNLIMCAIYQTSLVSFLTNPGYEKQITTIEEMFERNIHFLFLPADKIYFQADSPDWRFRKIVKIMTGCDNTDDCLFQIAHYRNYSIAVPRLYLIYVANRYINREGNLMLYWFKEDMVSYPVQMYFSKGHPLLHILNSYIVQILQSGIIDKWQKDLQNSMKEGVDNITDVGHSSDPKNLTLAQLEGAFMLLFIGLGIAAGFFVMELFYWKCQETRMKNKLKKMKQQETSSNLNK